MRGTIDLSAHKLANVYRAPAKRERWKAYKVPHPRDDIYRQLVRLVDGAVRDCFANHPEYLSKAGQRNARHSIIKRVAGTLWGYGNEVSFASQEARGRSAEAKARTPSAAATTEVIDTTSALPDQTVVSDTPDLFGFVKEPDLGGGACELDVPADKSPISRGLWRQRDGNLAEVERRLTLTAKGPHGEFNFDVWQGRCLHCNSKLSWMLDGRYAAVGTHAFDLMEEVR
jgi:hypothetical protein